MNVQQRSAEPTPDLQLEIAHLLLIDVVGYSKLLVNEQIEEFVGELDGVKTVESEMVFSPPWSPEMMSEDAKFALGY